MSSAGCVTVEDLAVAYLEAAHWGRGCSERAAYYRTKLAILERLFEFKLDDDERFRRLQRQWEAKAGDGWDPESARAMRDLGLVVDAAKTAIRMWCDLWPPFVVHLEGRAGPLERALRRRHEKRISRRIAVLREDFQEVLVSAMVLLDPALGSRRFSRSDLHKRGLPRKVPEAED